MKSDDISKGDLETAMMTNLLIQQGFGSRAERPKLEFNNIRLNKGKKASVEGMKSSTIS